MLGDKLSEEEVFVHLEGSKIWTMQLQKCCYTAG